MKVYVQFSILYSSFTAQSAFYSDGIKEGLRLFSEVIVMALRYKYTNIIQIHTLIQTNDTLLDCTPTYSTGHK